MGSLLTAAQKAALQSAFNDIHDTFSRNIYVYKEAKKVAITTNPNYNPIYDKNSALSQTVTKEVQKQSFKATIMYDTDRA